MKCYKKCENVLTKLWMCDTVTIRKLNNLIFEYLSIKSNFDNNNSVQRHTV